MKNNTLGLLLNQWEETYKKGLLSFWLLLLLSRRKAYPREIKGMLSVSTIDMVVLKLLKQILDLIVFRPSG